MSTFLVVVLHFDPCENHPQDSVFHLGIHAGDLAAVAAQTSCPGVLAHFFSLVAVAVGFFAGEKDNLLSHGVDSVADSVVWNTGQVDADVEVVVVKDLDFHETLRTVSLVRVVGRVQPPCRT